MAILPRGPRSTVSQFARSLGLVELESEDGSFSFDFSESGRLTLQASEDGETVLVSLTRRTILDGAAPLARLMAHGGGQPEGGFLHAGLNKSDQPVLILAFAAQSFDLPTLDRAINTLNARYAELGF